MGDIQTHFPPEFINRIDEIIIFVSGIYCGLIEKLMLMTLSMSSVLFHGKTSCVLSTCA